jgi:N-acetyl-gamma-glutamylphosphate reductase
MIKAGIFGGTGYMGGEALRVLLQHPQVEVAWVTAAAGAISLSITPTCTG